MPSTIFCPNCGELILDQPACAACNWQRPAEVQPVGQALWCADLATRLIKPACYPAVAAGLYLLGTETGRLLALDVNSGALVWNLALPTGCMAHGLAADGDRLFVGCEDVQPIPSAGKAFLALDARTGQELWRLPTPAHSLSAAAVNAGTVYFTSSDGVLHAADAATGRERWHVEHPAWAPAAPAVGEGVVVAGGRREVLTAYDTASGRELWRLTGGGWFAGQPCLAAGMAYATCWDGCVYAVDLRTGELRWKVRGERDNGFTTPPTVAGGRAFAGSRVFREVDGNKLKVYALLALDAATGKEQWRAYTERHIQPPAAAAGGFVFFGTDDRVLYAVDEASGEARWRMTVKSRVVTQPQVAGDRVIFAGRDGLVHAVRWLAQPKPEPLAPEAYASQGRWLEAANTWALRGDLARAAEVYAAHLNGPRQAAVLYDRAGQPALAAPQWLAAGELRRAAGLYQQVGDKSGQARVLAQMNEPLAAARLYEEEGQLAEAAPLYERGGDGIKAAGLYQALGQLEAAQQIWKRLGQWENIVKSLLDAQKPAEAGHVLEENGQLERAAVVYEGAGLLQDALRLRVQLGNLDRVALLAEKLGDYEQQASVLDKLGDRLPAARAYERAGEKAATAQPPDKVRAAALYERAARLYGELFEEEQVQACLRQVRVLRELPEIGIQVAAEKVFVGQQWNRVQVQVRNVGFGPARNIRVEFGGAFEARQQVQISGLRQQGLRPEDVFLRALKGQEGPDSPLEVKWTYEDLQGGRSDLSTTIPVRVDKDILSSIAAAGSVNIGEYYQSGAQKVEGGILKTEIHRGSGRSIVAESGPEGSRVEIQRAGPSQAVESCPADGQVPVQVRSDAVAVRRCPSCNLPIEDPEFRYCPDCSAPLR